MSLLVSRFLFVSFFFNRSKKHLLLRYFWQLSVFAIRYGAKDTTKPQFDFGVEIQWRIAKFRLGMSILLWDMRFICCRCVVKR